MKYLLTIKVSYKEATFEYATLEDACNALYDLMKRVVIPEDMADIPKIYLSVKKVEEVEVVEDDTV